MIPKTVGAGLTFFTPFREIWIKPQRKKRLPAEYDYARCKEIREYYKNTLK